MTHPTDTLTTCSCGCPITHEYVALERDAGRTKVQVCEGSDFDLLLFRCPSCRSHRSIEIPSMRRLTLLACLPGIAGLGGAA
jgi:hypothetical protein